MSEQRDFLCTKHNFFPQHPKLLNCTTNNALKPSRNQGRCIHFLDLDRTSEADLVCIKEKIEKYLKKEQYKYGEKSRLEKIAVLDELEEILEKKATKKLKKSKKSKKKNHHADNLKYLLGDELEAKLLALQNKRVVLQQNIYPSPANRKTHLDRNSNKIRKVKKALATFTQQ